MSSANGSGFDKDPRRRQEMRLRPAADIIYRQYLGAASITRYDEQDSILDIHFGIDARLDTTDGLLTLQEKFLSARYAGYKSITVEYWQNQHTQERGDWFKLACQLYFVGYEATSQCGFQLWVIANWAQIKIETAKGNIQWNHNVNKDGRARASFVYTDMTQLPPNCIIASSFKLKK